MEKQKKFTSVVEKRTKTIMHYWLNNHIEVTKLVNTFEMKILDFELHTWDIFSNKTFELSTDLYTSFRSYTMPAYGCCVYLAGGL
jgi:hypothetical protein